MCVLWSPQKLCGQSLMSTPVAGRFSGSGNTGDYTWTGTVRRALPTEAVIAGVMGLSPAWWLTCYLTFLK